MLLSHQSLPALRVGTFVVILRRFVEPGLQQGSQSTGPVGLVGRVDSSKA